MKLKVTRHAVDRYLERIGAPDAPDAEAAAHRALTCHAVQVAAAFGCNVVRLTHGRIIIEFTGGEAVVKTVVPLDAMPFQLCMPRNARPARAKPHG